MGRSRSQKHCLQQQLVVERSELYVLCVAGAQLLCKKYGERDFKSD